MDGEREDSILEKSFLNGLFRLFLLTQTLKVIHPTTGYHFLYVGGITLTIGRRGFAVYRDGKVVAQYTAMGR